MKQDMENENMTNDHETKHEEQNEASKNETGNVSAESADAASEVAEPADSELETLRKTADEHYQRFLRTQADFDNFRRRSRMEKEEFAKYASQKLIEALLPIVDNFERAVAASRENQDFESLAKGVEMTQRQLLQVLEAEGLAPIQAVGEPFNPELHQAIMQVEAEDGVESGTVVEEVQKGYKLKDKVIRPSMVKVSE